MTRWVAIVVVALCLSPSWVGAQTTIFTVTVQSAGIRQAPANGSPVVGYKAKGDVLDVRRNLGSWIEVAWPTAPTGVAYISSSMGLIGQSAPPVRRPMTIAEYMSTSAPATPALAPTGATCACVEATAASAQGTGARASSAAPAIQPGTTYVAPTHFVGLGGRFGGATQSAGATGRAWSRKRFGGQLEISREARTNAGTERLTSQQIAPSVLYALPSRFSDYLWIRPYVGGGATFYRTTRPSTMLAAGESSADNGLGLQMFGGGELTLAAIPRFALSADLGYRKWPGSFAGFEPRRLGLKVSGHWYVR
jgi:hypothetical protein